MEGISAAVRSLQSPYTCGLVGLQKWAISSQMASLSLPLVSREWKNGSNSSYNCTPFLHALLTKGK